MTKTTKKKKKEQVIATVETTIVVCQCGHAKFNVQNRTKTAVALECSKCSNKTSVKGPVALARVDEGEVALAVKDSVVRPDPDYDPGTTPKKESLAEQGYTMLRFRVGLEAKEKVVDKALEAIRILQTGKADYEEQTWQGHALEYLCADWIAGANPQVLMVVEEIAEDMNKLADAAREEGKSEQHIKRKLRNAKQKARAEAAEELGIVEADEPEEPEEPEAEEPEEEGYEVEELDPEEDPGEDPGEAPVPLHVVPEEDPGEDPDEEAEQVKDENRLKDSVSRVLSDYAEEYKEESGKNLMMLMNVTLGVAMKRADKDGGFVIQVSGDERAVDKTGNRPVTYFWLGSEPDNMDMELAIEYEDCMLHDQGKFEGYLQNPRIRADEVIPANIAKADVDWPAPSFCSGRIYLKEK